MNIFDQYGIKEVADVTFYSIHKKKDGSGGVYYVPALYIDTLKISSVEKTADGTWAEGGNGNARLIHWDYGKQINVTLEDALCTPASLGLCWNGVLNADWKNGQVNVDTDVCYCQNPVTRLSRLEKAIFPRDNRDKSTVSELLPKLSDDVVDKHLDILKKSSVVDGTKISGNGIVRGHVYRWKMAIESGVKSIAQVPDRFFDVKGRSYPIDWNRKVSVTSLPTYDNYKDAIIYKINSCEEVEAPRAKIIFDDAMEGPSTLLINELKKTYGYDNITVSDLTVTLKKKEDNNPADEYTFKSLIFYTNPTNNKKYVFADQNFYNQYSEFYHLLAGSVVENNNVFNNVDMTVQIAAQKDLLTLADFDVFYYYRQNGESSNESFNNTDGQFLSKTDKDIKYLDKKNDITSLLSELKSLYGEDIVTIGEEKVKVPKTINLNSYQYNEEGEDKSLEFEFDQVITLNVGNDTNAVLLTQQLYRQYNNLIRKATQEATSTNGKVDTYVLALLKREANTIYNNIGKFYLFESNPTKTPTVFFVKELDDKYSAYLASQADKVRATYGQNRAMTSLFSSEQGKSLIPDVLGSVEREIIQHRPITNADYLAIIVDENDDYHALIGIDSLSHDPYLNVDYNDNYAPITWYRPEVEVDVTQFKGLDMWIRFNSINEMIYFLITKYENDILDIMPSTINANENDQTYGDGGGYWAVNKQKTTVTKNEDAESVKKQGKLWAYVNPRTMAPYEDDYWFHQNEPLYVKSLTIAPKGKKIKANRITVRADQWPGMYMMVGETYIRNKDTGEDERMQIKFPLCKVKSDQTITLEASGDPTTFNLNLEVARPASGVMMEITSYEVSKKLLEGDNGCFYAVDGSTEVLSE